MGITIGFSKGLRKGFSRGLSSGSGYPVTAEKPKIRPGEPDPFNYVIKRTVRSPNGEYILAEVNYPNCKNFSGNKLLVVKTDLVTFIGRNSLDPHFLEEGSDMEVLARFRPTEEGWRAGRKFLLMLDPSLKKR